MKQKRLTRVLLVVFLMSVAICGGLYYYDNNEKSIADSATDKQQAFKPVVDVDTDNAVEEGDEKPLMDFTTLKNVNTEIIGWLSIPDTIIDYPIVQTDNNDFYLNHDAERVDNRNGAIFLDFRVKPDFSDFISIVYGHHMKSGRMFENLVFFKEKGFFDEHATGTIYTPTKTYELEIFASAVIEHDSELYDYTFFSTNEREKYLDTLKKTALYYRDIGVTYNDRIILLSTCSYEYNNARTVIAARLAD